MKMELTPEQKSRITAMTGRVTLMLQQRDFTATETSALIHCLQALLDEQCRKHGIAPVPTQTELLMEDCEKFFEAIREAMFWLPPGNKRDTTYNDKAGKLLERIKTWRGTNGTTDTMAGL